MASFKPFAGGFAAIDHVKDIVELALIGAEHVEIDQKQTIVLDDVAKQTTTIVITGFIHKADK